MSLLTPHIGSQLVDLGSALLLLTCFAIVAQRHAWSTWQRCTDLTNGFRAYRLALLRDPRVNVWQAWLDNYEYEYYVHWKAYTLGYKVAEVPVTKSYPPQKGVGYSKIRPFSGWWSMLRPFVLLALRIKR